MMHSPTTTIGPLANGDRALPSDPDRRLILTVPGPGTPSAGEVDGGWRSYSDDLEYELPELVAALTRLLGPIDRVLYRLDEWQHAPRRVMVGSRSVRLDGYRSQPAHTLGVRSLDGIRLALLVIPKKLSEPAAQVVLRCAGEYGNTESVQQLLGLTLTDVAPFTDPVVAAQRWDSDGGAAWTPNALHSNS
ncbi:DUF5994 family protein [Rhodococcoides fascians]|jgi:hypothetical protein|uniref:DUF5994 family protein n=1 Tax=Rhodococcoides fascians TaxID=1828 RepID=UPI0012D2B3F5|nr:DUF5994 family protein [Rhodococcus fascians]MDJ0468252.1 DUF5994 family protein [Rhodococcus fascians]